MTLTRNRWLALALSAIIGADWLTKFWVQNRVAEGTRHAVVDGWVWLAHSRNTGVAFSFLRDLPEGFRLPVLTIASLAGVAVAAYILLRTHDRWVRVAAALVIAGAVGNLGDRLMNGAVTDFILIRFFPFIFNVADVAITVGAILLAARLMLEERREAAAAAPAEP
jgi:signal peptidase II